MVNGLIIYLAVRYLLYDGWQLFGQRLFRFNMAVWSAPRRVAEVIVEIPMGDNPSIVLHLGTIAPHLWSELNAAANIAQLTVNKYGCLLQITLEYNPALSSAHYLVDRIYMIDCCNRRARQLAGMDIDGHFYLIHGNCCVRLAA